jgi:hypothetical protein
MFTPLYQVLVPLLVLGAICLHAMLALAVYLDGLHQQELGRPLWFLGPRAWAGMVLLYGLLGLLVYWLMHHSTLRPGRRPEPPPAPPGADY